MIDQIVKIIFYLLVIGQLSQEGMAYYQKVLPYLNDTGDLAFIIFSVNLFLNLVVAHHFFLFIEKKIKEKWQGIFLIVPLLFIQAELSTYKQEAQHWVTFEKWLVNFQKGQNEFQHGQNFKKMNGFFNLALMAVKDRPNAEFLETQTKIYSLYIRYLQKHDPRFLKEWKSIFDLYAYGETKELVMVHSVLANLYADRSDWDRAVIHADQCFELVKKKQLKLKDSMIFYDCRLIKTDSHFVKNEWDDFFKELKMMMDFKVPNSKFLSHGQKLLGYVDALKAHQLDEKALETALDILEIFRKKQNSLLMKETYHRLIQFYKNQGETEKSQIFEASLAKLLSTGSILEE